MAHLPTFEACPSWCGISVGGSIGLWTSWFTKCGNAPLVSLVGLIASSSVPLLRHPVLVEIHRHGGIIHLWRGVRRVPLPLRGTTLPSLVVIPFVPIVERAILSVVWKGVLWDVISPSDDIVDGLVGTDCFYGFLFQVLIGEGCSSSHHFL